MFLVDCSLRGTGEQFPSWLRGRPASPAKRRVRRFARRRFSRVARRHQSARIPVPRQHGAGDDRHRQFATGKTRADEARTQRSGRPGGPRGRTIWGPACGDRKYPSRISRRRRIGKLCRDARKARSAVRRRVGHGRAQAVCRADRFRRGQAAALVCRSIGRRRVAADHADGGRRGRAHDFRDDTRRPGREIHRTHGPRRELAGAVPRIVFAPGREREAGSFSAGQRNDALGRRHVSVRPPAGRPDRKGQA